MTWPTPRQIEHARILKHPPRNLTSKISSSTLCSFLLGTRCLQTSASTVFVVLIGLVATATFIVASIYSTTSVGTTVKHESRRTRRARPAGKQGVLEPELLSLSYWAGVSGFASGSDS